MVKNKIRTEKISEDFISSSENKNHLLIHNLHRKITIDVKCCRWGLFFGYTDTPMVFDQKIKIDYEKQELTVDIENVNLLLFSFCKKLSMDIVRFIPPLKNILLLFSAKRKFFFRFSLKIPEVVE